MAKDTTPEVLSPTNNATYKVVNGVKYFKLVSEFPGDYTKNCGLLGNEIDENFYFLRGYDIKDVIYDEDEQTLTITRVDEDYEPWVVNLGGEITKDRPNFSFDRTTGTLTITYPDGSSVVVDGFMVEGSEDISIGTDSTFRGKGTMYNPLGLARTERTGTYAPAVDYYDISVEGDNNFGKMPDPIGGKGYRVVTKELFNGFGYLYPYSAVQKIAEALEEKQSQWRIPTKADWDELLNAMECPEDRNHSAYTSTFLGKNAGTVTKSAGLYKEDESGNVITHTGMWKYYNDEINVGGQGMNGFDALPVGYSENRNSFMNNDDNDVEGFRLATAFWTSTTDPKNGQIYGKIFGHNSDKVYQQSFDNDSKLSIRLVKDYTLTNFEEYENILGLYYPTKLITGLYEDLPYSKIWTTINFYGDKDDLNGIDSTEWSGVTSEDASVKTVYFICEYDGEKWCKKQMAEGDSVVILNKDGEENYHEWRIIHGELVDTLQQTYDEFNRDFEEIRDGIRTLSSSTVALSASTASELGRIETKIDSEIERAETTETEIKESVSVLSGSVESLSAATASELERIETKFDGEVARLDGKIDSETERAIASESALSETILVFSSSVVSEIIRIDSAITQETERATVAENSLSNRIDSLTDAVSAFSAGTVSELERIDAAILAEASRAQDAENGLNDKIQEEAGIREANDIKTGDYTLGQDGTTLKTNGGDNVNIITDNKFFDFGQIIGE